MKYDILIIGGGLVGSSIAYFLAREGRGGSIAVIEPDSAYHQATTPKGAGGIRQLFSLPENIWMSRYSRQFYSEFASTMRIDGKGDSVDIDYQQHGYLFVVGPGGAKQLEANHRLQTGEGVHAELLDVADLQRRFPSLELSDIALGCHSPDDAGISSKAALMGFRRKAEALGVTYIDARVTGLETRNRAMRVAHLAEGEPIQADIFVNAAGAWAKEVSALAGMSLPIEPMCRVKHFWRSTEGSEIEPLPLVKDETGLFFRPFGDGFVGGRPSWEIQPGFIFDQQPLKTYFEGYFERTVHPLLNARLPAFSTTHCEQSWAGHYAQNRLDGNMILGPWVNGATNFYVASGFSGHGVMHAPAVGLALSELILDGCYATMDVGRMSYQRVLDHEPYAEMGII